MCCIPKMDKYKVLKVIGKGTFGTVSKIQRISDGKVGVTRAVVGAAVGFAPCSLPSNFGCADPGVEGTGLWPHVRSGEAARRLGGASGPRAEHSPFAKTFRLVTVARRGWPHPNTGAVPCTQSSSAQVNFLRELRHPFIVKYYDRIIDKQSTKLYIVMEACENGDLGGLIKRCRHDK